MTVTRTTESHKFSIQQLVLKLKSHIPNQWKQRYYFYFHLAYIILLGLFSGLLVFIIEQAHSHAEFIDVLFITFSATCVCGLSAADVSKFSVGSKVIILLLMIFGKYKNERRIYFNASFRRSNLYGHPSFNYSNSICLSMHVEKTFRKCKLSNSETGK